MGTRGAVGFRAKNQDKITYNHFDSYPSGLGQDVLSFIRRHSIEDLKNTANNIQLIQKNSVPSESQIKECRPWTNLSVSNQSTSDWYCLLRESQGNLDAYTNGLKYMIDGQSFLLDSLFCEFAYIINVDKNQLEFYSGFNKKARERKGRYASLRPENSRPDSYYGVALLWKIPLNTILEVSEEEIGNIVSKMDKKANSFYNRQDRELRKAKETMSV